MCNKSIGKSGEGAAVQYLKDMGYEIVKVNYRDKQGEIDIIALDRDVLAFIEVKTRRSIRYGTPAEAVNHAKQRRLTRVALSYLHRNRIFYEQVRFDVVEIMLRKSGIKEIRLLKGAFDAVI